MAISFITTGGSTGNDPGSGNWDLQTGLDVGDIIIVWWFTFAGTKTIAEPAEITQLYDASEITHGRLFIGYNWCTGSAGTVTWTSNSIANSTTCWGKSVFRGVGTGAGNPFEADSGAPTQFDNENDPDPPAVTPLTTGAAALTIFGKRNDYTSILQPTGYTSAGEQTSDAGNDACIGAAYKLGLTGGVEENPDAWTLGGGAVGDDGFKWTGILAPTITQIYGWEQGLARQMYPQRTWKVASY